MVDRTVIGRRADGSYGLDASLPGFDVMTAAEKEMAFSTRWAGASIIHQTGIVSECRGKTVTFPALPYVPLVYLILRGNNSDLWSSVQYVLVQPPGLRFCLHPFCRIKNNSLYFDDSQDSRLPAIRNYDCRYAIFKIPGR